MTRLCITLLGAAMMFSPFVSTTFCFPVLAVLCELQQNSGAGLANACTCYWDNATDGVCSPTQHISSGQLDLLLRPVVCHSSAYTSNPLLDRLWAFRLNLFPTDPYLRHAGHYAYKYATEYIQAFVTVYGVLV